MQKKLLSFMTAAVLFMSLFFSNTVYASEFKDVPQDHWAYGDIKTADELGIMSGTGNGNFGIGNNVKRSEFVSMIVRMFQWDKENTDVPSFQDNTDTSKWYYEDIETAVKHGAVKTDSKNFRPEDPITREEIAVMLVRALGYDTLAQSVSTVYNPFVDVTGNKGYITIAYDFGIISGKSSTVFDPKGTALREEAASMMIRAYNKYHQKLQTIHGFYAFSSYAQKEIAAQMDEVSVGWSALSLDVNGDILLNTKGADNNEWKIPDGYEEAVKYLKDNQTSVNLNIFLSAAKNVTLADGTTENPANEILLNPQNRKVAVSLIINELTREYPELGYNPYDGVTIDFENLRGSQMRSSFSQFLIELSSQLTSIDKKLYVAVQPPLKNSASYYDGYDFYTIGEVSDRIILMAHDYQANSISQEVMDSGFTSTPVTPFDEVFFALHELASGTNAVKDKEKIMLAFSMNSVGWAKKDGFVTNAVALKPSYEEINSRLGQGAVYTYSDKYRNPYITYADESGQEVTVWYEDAQSIEDKIELAKMFGINEVSVWRIGTIPNYNANHLNIWDTIQNNK